MKRFSIILLYATFILANSGVQAGDAGEKGQIIHPLMIDPNYTIRNSVINTNISFSFQTLTSDGIKLAVLDNQTVAAKSPRKALFLSLVLPGAGEFYSGSYKKSAAFFGFEVFAWAWYAVYHKKGKDIEKDFMDYADAHWSEDEYWEWMSEQSGYTDKAALREYERENFTHQLPETKTQQYYEMIGKYNQFNAGWDDRTDELPPSESGKYYMRLRADSNKNFKRATTGATIALFNHVLSAMDAAWTAKLFNKKKSIKTSLRIKNFNYCGQNCPVLSFKVKW